MNGTDQLIFLSLVFLVVALAALNELRPHYSHTAVITASSGLEGSKKSTPPSGPPPGPPLLCRG